MEFPIEIMSLAIAFMLAIVGLAYLALRIAGSIWRFTVTVHRRTFVKEMTSFALLIVVMGMIDANCTPGTLFYPVWHWLQRAFVIFAPVAILLGIVCQFLPNMRAKQDIEEYIAFPIINSFRISRNKLSKHLESKLDSSQSAQS